MTYDVERPWVRQPFDTDLSWSLFQDYLSLPIPRRMADLAKRTNLPISQLEALAHGDGWVLRASAWDRHLDTLRTETIERVVKEDAQARAERQGLAGQRLQKLGSLAVDRLIRILEQNPDFGASEVSCRDAIRAIGIGVRVERLALGDATEKVEVTPDMSRFTIEELRQIRELQEKVR